MMLQCEVVPNNCFFNCSRFTYDVLRFGKFDYLPWYRTTASFASSSSSVENFR